MRAAAFMFATDLVDEGFETVLDNVQGRAGLGGVSLACSYHHARDVFPHNPVRRVRFLDGGAVFFQPDAGRFRDAKIQPHVAALAREVDVLATLCDHAQRRGMAVRAWTVYLHNTALGSRYPDCAVRNAYGDPYITHLCPANPDVRAYAQALSADIARYGVQAILAESLCYHPFEHGYHHERSFIPFSPLARYLFSLCFCEHCLAAGRRQGVDTDALRSWVRSRLDEALAGGGTPDGDVTWDAVSALAGGELGGYLRARSETVTTLVAEAQAAVEAVGDTRFVFLDGSGAAKGYASGVPTGEAAPSIAWQDGVDVAEVARRGHGLMAVGYARDPERLRFDLSAYHALTPASLAVALRPMHPDCDAPANLRAKVQIARQLGAEWVDFYHYGFMPLDRLDWVREAVV